MSDSMWPIPTEEEVALALASIADLSLRNLFFGGLENPEWLEPLRRLGTFDSPPEPFTDPDGAERVLPWPEGDYLARVADERPEEVSAIFRRIEHTRNPWALRSLIAAASKMPGSAAEPLVPSVARTIRESQGWLDAEQVFTLTTRLAQDSAHARVAQLLSAMFEPIPGTSEEMAIGTRRRVQASIGDYYYTELLPRALPLLAALDDLAGLRMLVSWLATANRIQGGSTTRASDHDTSAIWRPSIAAHAQNLGLHELTDSLIDATRELALLLVRGEQGVGVLRYLNESELPIVRRIAVEVAAQALSDAEPSNALVGESFGLLTDSALMKIDSRPEYVHLVRALLPKLSDHQCATWVELVLDQSWQGSDDVMRRIAGWGKQEGETVTDDDVAATRDHMMHRFLQPLADCLPDPLAERLSGLEADRGVIEHAEFGSYTESFTGPTSPKTADEIRLLSPEELSRFLSEWRPVTEDHWGPSVEGLARELETATELNPELVADVADRLRGLNRSYVRAALGGWTKAISQGFRPSEQIWDLVAAVVGEADDGSDWGGAHDFEAEDPAWRFAQRRALDLISAQLGALSKPDEPELRRLWTLVKPLTRHPDPTPEHEARYGGSNMDPLTFSLNTTRPAALRVAIALASASHGEEAPGQPSSLEQEILAEIAKHVDESADPSLAVAAVVGEGLGRLAAIDPVWVESRAGSLFALVTEDEARRAWSDVVVSVALRVYHPGRAFLGLMRPALQQILSPEYWRLLHVEGWREPGSTPKSAAHHLISANLLGIIDRSDPELQSLFDGVFPTDVVSQALGHIGWLLMRSEMDKQTVPLDYVNRARDLVDWRVAEIRAGRASAEELVQFYWWPRFSRFSPDWWLPILQLVAESVALDSRGMLGGPLAEAAAVAPALAVQAFEMLYGQISSDWRGFDLVQHAPRILASALSSGDETAVVVAQRVRDLLGRQGHFQALSDLDQLLAQTEDQGLSQ